MKKLLLTLLILYPLQLFGQSTIEGTYQIGESGDFSSFTKAGEVLNHTPFSGDVQLVIEEGVYIDSLILDHLETNGYGLSITAMGAKENTIIYPLKSLRDTEAGFYFKNIDGLEIEGLTFKSDSLNTVRVETILNENSLIGVDSCTNVAIRNIIAESDTIIGTTYDKFASSNIRLIGVHNVLIDSSYLEGAMSNIAFVFEDSSTNIEISNTSFEHSGFDVFSLKQQGSNLYIHDCEFLSERYLRHSNHIYLYGNPTDLNTRSGFYGDVIIRDNYFNGNNSDVNTKCVYLQYFDDAIIERNEMLGGYYAIFMVHGDSVVINQNKIVTDVYKNIECGGNNKYYLTNNTFISHNGSYNIDDQLTFEELVIANNTFYRHERPTNSSASFLNIDAFQGDSLAIVNNLFVMADTLDRIIRLDDFEHNLETSSFVIDHNVVVKSNPTAHFKRYYYMTNMIVNDDNDLDTSFVTLDEFQNYLPQFDQNSYVTTTHNFEYLPSPSTESRAFIDSADFHLKDGNTFRQGMYYEGIGNDYDNDPRIVSKGVDVGADQYYLNTDISSASCDDDLTVSIENAHHNITSYTWHFGDGTISTEASPTHTYEEMGEYTVSLVSCDDMSYCDSVSFIITVEDQNCKPEDEEPLFSALDQTSFVVYPNPTKGSIQFSSPKITGKVNAQLVNINGVVLYEAYEELSSLSLSVSNVLSGLQPGLYILKMEEGGNSYKKRIVLGE
ncbi:PKD domain-containing protein [Flammeovirga sp. EKP202]|uniref:PKD domain-containing protein n=1 Tax=Flammeovirga sp. EKP202 TaxID=2770592 RepID=UPI00165EF0A2|nr:PKD domain-containing protein [Flammeovirga sp. EKP202]MBD0404754.1 T9SS type A sorting domain-containing protein [Flammeovirga sp. EKP202]